VAYRLASRRLDVPVPPLRVRADCEIPLARGLGGSAAAIVAGLSAFEAVTGRELGIDRLLELGVELEGHADNLAASVLGGLVTACTDAGGAPVAVRSRWPPDIKLVLVIPDIHVRTEAARAVLPDQVPRRDAVFNVQRAALFTTALAERRWQLLRVAMQDRLHQQYRAPLIPGLQAALEIELPPGCLGVALSGAGSAMVALATGDFEEIGRRLVSGFRAAGLAASARVLEVDSSGRRIECGEQSGGVCGD
jgi:homoserine kinase